jgi:ABC-type multidrug transport system fused ATPase/permease subunit
VALFIVDGLDASGPQIVRWAIDHLVRVTSGHGAAAGPDSPLAARLPAAWFGPEAFMHGMWVYGLAMVLIVAVTGFFRYFMSMGFAIGGITLSNDLRKNSSAMSSGSRRPTTTGRRPAT